MGNYKGKDRKKKNKTKQNKYLLALLTSAGADQFPKRAFKRGSSDICSPGKSCRFQLPKVPFPGFPNHSDRILANSIHLG